MTVPALRIKVNGQLVAIAGGENLSLLTATIGLGSGADKYIPAGSVVFGVMGLDLHSSQPKQLNWGSDIKLKEGDQVTIEIVQVEQTTPPDKVLSSPSPAQLRAEAKRK